MLLPHPRRALALAGAVIVMLTLTSCGFNASTTQVYTPAAGVNDRDGTVDVLNAVIVSAEEGSGTFIASMANNDTEEAASFTGLTGGDQGSLTVAEFPAVEIAPGGLVNLAEEGGVEVEGDFAAGDFVAVTVQLGETEQVTLEVPVVTNCDIWAGLDGPTDEAACEPEHHDVGH